MIDFFQFYDQCIDPINIIALSTQAVYQLPLTCKKFHSLLEDGKFNRLRVQTILIHKFFPLLEQCNDLKQKCILNLKMAERQAAGNPLYHFPKIKP
ncbi:MAG: hypothetical protein LW832_10385 [Parachlamydia sp.]|jgi:hypothetical protein|nr:hypothetical protein [Parachlamydia sp.]